MSFTDRKITDSDIATYGVQSQPNKLTGSAQQNKQAFDKLIAEVVKAKFNALIDELTALTAAEQIGVDVQGLTSTNVEAAIAEVLAVAQTISQGGVAPDTITRLEIVDGEVIADKLGSDVLPENVGIKYGTSVPTTATISNGQIYLKLPEEE